jgi:hypothetical protein
MKYDLINDLLDVSSFLTCTYMKDCTKLSMNWNYKTDLIIELSDISSSEMHTHERLHQTKYELS